MIRNVSIMFVCNQNQTLSTVVQIFFLIYSRQFKLLVDFSLSSTTSEWTHLVQFLYIMYIQFTVGGNVLSFAKLETFI